MSMSDYYYYYCYYCYYDYDYDYYGEYYNRRMQIVRGRRRRPKVCGIRTDSTLNGMGRGCRTVRSTENL